MRQINGTSPHPLPGVFVSFMSKSTLNREMERLGYVFAVYFTKALLKMFRSGTLILSTLLPIAISFAAPSISPAKSQLEHTMAYGLEQRARSGNLDAQRELADRLTKGGAEIQPDRALACAWRIVIAAGGMPGVTATDVESRRVACDNLASAEQSRAAAQARSIFRQLHGRELVLPADFFGGPARGK